VSRDLERNVTGKVLVVDDESVIRDTMRQFLEREGHEVTCAEDAVAAEALIRETSVDVLVSDILMPRVSGVELMKRCREISPATKVILVTGEPRHETAAEAVRQGAFDYLTKPLNRGKLVKTVGAAMAYKRLEDENRDYRDHLEVHVRQRTETLTKTLVDTVETLGYAMELRDPYTAGHQRRVAEVADAISGLMGVDEERRESLRMAALVHDIGKLCIPAEILVKPTRFTLAEWNLVQQHSMTGKEILSRIDFPWPLAEIVLAHHERMDGSGYPAGIKGNEIRQEARILAVADAVEAMASDRPYRPALGLTRALAILSEERGVAYDEETADACLALFNDEGFTFTAR
jgi:putative two-component system response regulator